MLARGRGLRRRDKDGGTGAVHVRTSGITLDRRGAGAGAGRPVRGAPCAAWCFLWSDSDEFGGGGVLARFSST